MTNSKQVNLTVVWRAWLPGGRAGGALAIAWLVLVGSVNVSVQSPIFFVRHAERADGGSGTAPKMAADPDLSEAGRARAESLAFMLKDAGIRAIFATEYKRTQQTAAPLAKLLGLPITTESSKDMRALAERVKSASGAVLVVGHSNTLPEIIKLLGAETPLEIGDAEYDNLFVLLLGDKPALVRMHFR